MDCIGKGEIELDWFSDLTRIFWPYVRSGPKNLKDSRRLHNDRGCRESRLS
jgi:hypothetical protein